MDSIANYNTVLLHYVFTNGESISSLADGLRSLSLEYEGVCVCGGGGGGGGGEGCKLMYIGRLPTISNVASRSHTIGFPI